MGLNMKPPRVFALAPQLSNFKQQALVAYNAGCLHGRGTAGQGESRREGLRFIFITKLCCHKYSSKSRFGN